MTQLRRSRAGYTVQCVLCGRAAGEVLGGVFRRDPRVQAPRMDHGVARCGECGGNLYLEPGLAGPGGAVSEVHTPTKTTSLPVHVGGHVPAGPSGGR
jgi:hypothetical protein